MYMRSNSYTTGCPPVRADTPRALASGYSSVQAKKPWITILHHPPLDSVDLAQSVRNILRQRLQYLARLLNIGTDKFEQILQTQIRLRSSLTRLSFTLFAIPSASLDTLLHSKPDYSNLLTVKVIF